MWAEYVGAGDDRLAHLAAGGGDRRAALVAGGRDRRAGHVPPPGCRQRAARVAGRQAPFRACRDVPAPGRLPRDRGARGDRGRRRAARHRRPERRDEVHEPRPRSTASSTPRPRTIPRVRAFEALVDAFLAEPGRAAGRAALEARLEEWRTQYETLAPHFGDTVFLHEVEPVSKSLPAWRRSGSSPSRRFPPDWWSTPHCSSRRWTARRSPTPRSCWQSCPR